MIKDRTPLELFLMHLKAKRMSEKTIKAYKSDLETIGQITGKPKLRNLTEKDIQEYIKNNKNSTSTLNRRLIALREFFKDAIRYEYITYNPMQRIDNLKAEKRLPQFLEKDDVQHLLDRAEKRADSIKGIRDCAIIYLLYYTGMRIGELHQLNIDDIKISGSNSYVRVFGKGQKERIVPLHDKCIKPLITWLNERKTADNIPIQERALFTTCGNSCRNGVCGRMSYSLLGLVTDDLLYRTGEKKRSAHILRHSVATELCNKGVAIQNVQAFLGHKDINTTTIYIHTSRQALQESVMRL
jgi:integrase/recombinase XerC